MGSWRFFNKMIHGQNCIGIQWFWSVRDEDGSREASVGFATLPACISDASRKGYTCEDDAQYEPVDLRWHI